MIIGISSNKLNDINHSQTIKFKNKMQSTVVYVKYTTVKYPSEGTYAVYVLGGRASARITERVSCH